MEKRMSADFVKDFITEIFYNKRPEGLYIYNDYEDVYIYEGDYLYEIENRGTFEGHDWHLNVGATKAVFIFSDFDEVIKIGFQGELIFGDAVALEDELYVTGTIYCEDDDVDDNDVLLKPYSVNYINLEMEIYDSACPETREIFLENRYVCSVGEVEVTVQDKIEYTFGQKYTYSEQEDKWETIQSSSPKVDHFVIEECSRIYLPNLFLSQIYDYYNEQVPENVLTDLTGLHDMHNNNIGYIRKGDRLLPVIHDYGGFDD